MEKNKLLEIELYVSISIIVENEKEKQTNERSGARFVFFVQII